MLVYNRASGSKETDSLVTKWFRADSGTNLIKQGKIFKLTVWPDSSVVGCSHSLREFRARVPAYNWSPVDFLV